MPTDADTLQALVQALTDSLMVIAPPGWMQAELEIAAAPDGLRLGQLSAKGPATEPPPRAPLNMDLREEAIRLGQGLTELAQVLAENGKQWTPGKVLVERGEGSTDWKLLNPDGSLAWFTRLLPDQLDALLFTDALFDLLRGTGRAFHSLQGAFAQKLGNTSEHDYSEADQVLSLTAADGRVLRARAQLVGSYTRSNFLWVWGWAVDELSPACADKVKRVCVPDAPQPGLSALWRDHFHCDEGFAWALAAHAMVSIGARGLLRAEAPDRSMVVVYALLEDPT